MAEVKKGDVGTVFRYLFQDQNQGILDLGAQTTLECDFERGDGSVITRPLAFTQPPDGVGDGSDGLAEYVSVAGDIQSVGEWEVEGFVELPSGKWTSDRHKFPVKAPIKERP